MYRNEPSSSRPSADTPSESHAYDPSLEWPGEEEPGCDSDQDTSSTPFLCLVVLDSGCLSSKRRLATLTGYPDVEFGRDKPLANSVTPRIRLKEMEVSKVHATVYLNVPKKEWGIVDMGSKHGTFLRIHASSDPSLEPIRLSPPRIASLPRMLHHLDSISIGSTSFSVHIHDSGLACDVCASSGTNEIPLFSVDEAKAKPVPPNALPPPSRSSQDPKRSLAMLKSSLLRQHTTPSGSSSPNYMDRAARRRQMHGHSGAPGANQVQSPSSSTASSSSVRDPSPFKAPVSDPPTPLPTDNVGHRLLSKMGWEPGTGLGDDSGGIVEPIQVNHHEKRAGLGTKRPLSLSVEKSSEDWWKTEKQRRYDSLRAMSERPIV